MQKKRLVRLCVLASAVCDRRVLGAAWRAGVTGAMICGATVASVISALLGRAR